MAFEEATTDVGEIWQSAVSRYEKITGVEISSMTPARNIDDVLGFTQERSAVFGHFRHNKGKLDKFRTAVGNSMGPIEKVGNCLASAASLVRGRTLISVPVRYRSLYFGPR
jgi:hypothetical protein